MSMRRLAVVAAPRIVSRRLSPSACEALPLFNKHAIGPDVGSRCFSSSARASANDAGPSEPPETEGEAAPARSRAAARGYKSIGSFHSESVEVLATLPDDSYVPPSLPFDCPACPLLDQTPPLPADADADAEHDATSSHDYGQDFLLDRQNWTFLNHGAFGAALRCGHDRANLWREHLESQPLRYFDRDLLPHLAHANRSLADFVGGHKDSLALVQNATVGLNAVIGGYAKRFGSDAMVLYLDVSYGSVKKMVKHYVGGVGGGTVKEIPFQDDRLPLSAGSVGSEATFVEALDASIAAIKRDGQGHKLRNSLLILDHTTSNTATNVPIDALARRAKEDGMLVLVDGAHGLLAQKLDMMALTEAGVDFYVSNCHKWLGCPRGAAMLYCGREDLRESVLRVPPVVSHGVDDGFLSRFVWDGCRDYAAELSLRAVIDYWKHLRPDNVRARMRSTLQSGVQILSARWHSDAGFDVSGRNQETTERPCITIAPLSLHSPMALVRLPDVICGDPANGGERRTSADAKAVQDFLFDNMVEVPIKCIVGVLYVRISAHIYNKAEEFDHLGLVILRFPGF